MKKIGKLRKVSAAELSDSGISIGFECLDREIFDPEQCYDKLAAIGVKNARCQTGWLRCEKERGIYDFAWLDDIVDNLLRRGVKPWFNVTYGNPLYMENACNAACVGMVPLYFGEECLQAWQNYVCALAKRFRGRVSCYEIWNEPECNDFWQPRQADPLEYAKLIRITAACIKEEIPDARIGACSMWVFKPEYMVPFVQSGIASELSFYSTHAYRIQPELHFDQELSALRRLLDANGGEHVELWQGESGYASWFPENHWLGVYVMESEVNQAKWLLRRFFYDAACGVKMTSFFQMVDMTAKPYQKAVECVSKPACHGILKGDDYSPKQSYHSLGHVAAVFDEATRPADLFGKTSLYSAVPKSEKVSRLPDVSLTMLTFERNSYPLYAYYIPEDVQVDFAGLQGAEIATLNGECSADISEPVLVDMLSGQVFAVSASHQGEHSCWFGELPVMDYPIVLTDRQAIADRIEEQPS